MSRARTGLAGLLLAACATLGAAVIAAGAQTAATGAAPPETAAPGAGLSGGIAVPQPPEGPEQPRGPEQVVAGLSQDDVSITTSFTGSEILIYGAIKRDAPIPPGPGIGVIVTVEGPSQPVTIRRKERRAGIWINTDRLTVGAAPDFYVVATSGRLASMLDPNEDTRHRISIPLAIRAFAGPVNVPDATAFTEALLRLRSEAGRYRLDEGKVRIVDQTLFRADVNMPSNLVEGEYKARIFLIRDGRVVDVERAPIEVRKVGLERWLYRLAIERPFWYGLMSLAIAIAAGWGASAAFRALRRP